MTEISSFLAPGGNTDNAPLMPALIADMAANPGETYTAKRGQVFRFDAGGFVFPNGVRLRTEGARFDIGASIGGAAFINFGDDLDADHLNIRALGGCLVKRAVTIGARPHR